MHINLLYPSTHTHIIVQMALNADVTFIIDLSIVPFANVIRVHSSSLKLEGCKVITYKEFY